ncbi:2Fe-2S iron-sulfur cluster-binding protein [Ruegeria sp. HKCCD8929]|uniref:2Fe-2S iron-sulfur cluster-binding protein n=1 Tax=Ruegeria sp. HKCCD8929 TaxID=2683006 RepID=UPI00148786AF|nr:2Fe-2S iron-sulfur cluster-binding protein [Ruegeria sp. HKCCD8929]
MKLRLNLMIGTGMVMFVFITMHLANLAIGLVSVQAMEDWRWTLSGVWSTFLPLKILLQVSLVVHFLIALVSLYMRNTLKVPAYDMAQMAAGVLIIPLLGTHVFGVMALRELGLVPTYPILLNNFWVVSPVNGLQQVVMLVVAWIHGAIGVYTWLQSRDGSVHAMKFFYPFVVALPILAMLGYVEAGRQIIPVEEGELGFVVEDDPNADRPPVDPEMVPVVVKRSKERTKMATRISLGLVAAVMAARWLRLHRRRRERVQVTYSGNRSVTFQAETGLTLLEMVRENNIPHANICRGRGRCGTCRVRVLSDDAALGPPGQLEAKVLARWHAGPDERLACQLKPLEGKLVVERVIEADYSNLDYTETKTDSDLPAGAV